MGVIQGLVHDGFDMACLADGPIIENGTGRTGFHSAGVAENIVGKSGGHLPKLFHQFPRGLVTYLQVGIARVFLTVLMGANHTDEQSGIDKGE